MVLFSNSAIKVETLQIEVRLHFKVHILIFFHNFIYLFFLGLLLFFFEG